ncbi:hypothetical protein DERF_016733 [Dermatophagoides farinae]|uniref:Uncharacterized protein n=1 Tax=Dermatophagoides farinae TaxID=6954 RepID=A0A922HJI2_DERFA|nr:hypothetical protein DERF_016733 [Dermatophagoides farinae]
MDNLWMNYSCFCLSVEFESFTNKNSSCSEYCSSSIVIYLNPWSSTFKIRYLLQMKILSSLM